MVENVELSGRLVVAVAALWLSTSPAWAEERLRVGGTGTALGSMQRLAAAFERTAPGYTVQVLPSLGSAGAVKAVASGALEIGLIARPLEPREAALGLVARPYARTPFVVAVGSRTGITNITSGEMARIYRGELTTWPTGERVRLVLRPRSDADTELVRGFSSELAAAVDVALAREGMLMAATNQECDELLARTPGSIGFSSLTQILTESRVLTPLNWNGVAGTVSNLVSGAYPLVRTLSVVVRRSPSPAVSRFLAFLSSLEARHILEETGNQTLTLQSID